MKEIDIICTWVCVKKINKKRKSDVTPFVIINMLISILIYVVYLLHATDYSYVYFAIKLLNLVTCN